MAIRPLLAVTVPTVLMLAAALTVIRAQTPRPMAHGRELYRAHCAGCHGDALQGQPDWRQVNSRGRLPAPPLNGSGHAWMHSDEELGHIIKSSVLDIAGPGYQTDMPAFGKMLSDSDIRDLVAFIRSRWPNGAQAAQSFLNPGRAGMPAHVDPDWRLPADCEEPVRRAPPVKATP